MDPSNGQYQASFRYIDTQNLTPRPLVGLIANKLPYHIRGIFLLFFALYVHREIITEAKMTVLSIWKDSTNILFAFACFMVLTHAWKTEAGVLVRKLSQLS